MLMLNTEAPYNGEESENRLESTTVTTGVDLQTLLNITQNLEDLVNLTTTSENFDDNPVQVVCDEVFNKLNKFSLEIPGEFATSTLHDSHSFWNSLLSSDSSICCPLSLYLEVIFNILRNVSLKISVLSFLLALATYFYWQASQDAATKPNENKCYFSEQWWNSKL